MTRNETGTIELSNIDQYVVAKLLDDMLGYSRTLNRISMEITKTDADTGTYLYRIGQEIDDALMSLELVLGIDTDGILTEGSPDFQPGSPEGLAMNLEMKDLEESLDN